LIFNKKNWRKKKMNRKIVGIFVSTLLFASLAIPISAQMIENEQPTIPISKDADVPTWNLGDSWTYEMYYMQNGDLNESYSFEVICDITYEVVDDSGDTYKLEGTAADLDFSLFIGDKVLKPTRFISIGTEMELKKSDLSLVKWNQYAKGIFLPRLGPIPLPIPIQVHAESTTTFGPSWNLMPFPLYDGKSGDIGPIDFTDSGKTTLYWGLIKIYEGENTWGFSKLDYTCNEEQVTVPAGTFSSYNVSAIHYDYDWFFTNYAKEVGNSVKQLIHIEFSNHVTYYHMELELKSTNYEP
jgi:hypothetical protein